MRSEKEFFSGTLVRWPREDYGFALNQWGDTVFVHRHTICKHLQELVKGELISVRIYFYPKVVERGFTSTRTLCVHCHGGAMQRRHQRAALREARSFLHGRRFKNQGFPDQFFHRNLVADNLVLQAAERAAAGKIMARASQEDILTAATHEIRRMLTTGA